MALSISTLGFTTFVENQVAAIQGACNTLLDFTIGSILRALVEGVTGTALWIQAEIVDLLAKTRASSSSLADLDSWMADFAFTRLAASGSKAQLTYTSLGNYATQRQIAPGAQAQTFDGSQPFTVIADPTNGAWNTTLNAYVAAAGTASVTVTAQAVNTGSATNALAGTITQITTPVPFFDTVTNAAAATGGADAETDTAFRTRFVAYLASLSKATKAAIAYAITTVQTGLSYVIVENMTYAGASGSGHFYIVVDDGSGYPSGTLLSNVSNAVDAVCPLGTYFDVHAPTVLTANVSMTLTTTGTHSVAVMAATAALNAYIDGLTLGTSLPYSRLAQVAYGASTQITNVTSVLLNSGTSDLTATAQQKILAGTVTVT